MSQRGAPAYAELQAVSNFSFLEGGSHPQELVATAHALGLAGLGLCDRNSLAGVVRAHVEAKAVGLPLRVGARLDFVCGGPSLLCYPEDRDAYGRLCRLLTLGKRRAPKGQCRLTWNDLFAEAKGQVLIVAPPEGAAAETEGFADDLRRLADLFPGQVYLAGRRAYAAADARRLGLLARRATRAKAPLVAVNDVLYHGPERRPLQDVLTCIREKRTVAEAGWRLQANAERHLKPPHEMARLFRDHPDALTRTLEILERCRFDLDSLRYEYPNEPVPAGMTPIAHLSALARRGALWRYPHGVPAKVEALLDQELALIEALDIPQYFLTVHDVVAFARNRGILCQGRGSAANSAVCFCLGITAVDPSEHDLLFARFISRERDEPPDIDVDFEHERREEVIQYIYERYGRDRAAICATVIHYRPRSAIREVGKALGLTEDVTARMADMVWGSWGDALPEAHVAQAGLDPAAPEIARAVRFARQIMGFPRHLSQHVGGFVLTEKRLDETVPIGQAAMADRTFLEWDKDDIDALGLMKVDVLALGMLSCLKRGFDLLTADGTPLSDVADVPAEDAEVYAMLSRADSVGVFQVESRAQMSMLPRLRPRVFYDLVIEVAIVRPGPIQGDMVHPYLRRREGLDPVSFPAPAPEHGPADELKQVLGKTLGVPLFQEQAMRLAIEAARFTPEEANGLRRAMATFRHNGDVGVYRDKFIGGMTARGYARDFAERCFKQIEGFGSYGFPESHAASFAKLVYASAWIKRHRPDVFCAAILNSQPMGFYQPAQLVRDAREHGVEIRPVDALHSAWDCTLEPRPGKSPFRAVRLGMRLARGLRRDDAERLIAARTDGVRGLEAMGAAGVPRRALERLAEADAFRSLGMDRRAALWAVRGLDVAPAQAPAPLLALMGPRAEPITPLAVMPAAQQVAEDYRALSLSLKAHPLRFLREDLAAWGAAPLETLKDPRRRNGERLRVAGLVLVRQRPGTAKGVTFLTLEDETGAGNVVIWKDRFETDRRLIMTSALLGVEGRLQRHGEVIHLVGERFQDLSPLLSRLRAEAPSGRRDDADLYRSRDFH